MSTAINGSQEIILIFNGSNHFSAFHVDFSLRRPVSLHEGYSRWTKLTVSPCEKF